jgi:flagellar biosynthesis chaperone FliJ
VFDDFLSFSDGVPLAATMHIRHLEMTVQQLQVAIQQAESEIHHEHNIQEALLSIKCDANDYEEVNGHFD